MSPREIDLIEKALFNIYDIIDRKCDEYSEFQDFLMERFSHGELEDIEILWRKLSGQKISIQI